MPERLWELASLPLLGVTFLKGLSICGGASSVWRSGGGGEVGRGIFLVKTCCHSDMGRSWKSRDPCFFHGRMRKGNGENKTEGLRHSGLVSSS